MRQEGRRAGEPRTITHRKEDATARGSAPLFRNAQPCPSPSPRPSASGACLPLPDLSARPPAPGPACGTLGEGHSPGRPCSFHGGSWSKQGCVHRGALGSAGKRRPRKQLWASELGGARGGGEEGLPASLLPAPLPPPPASSWAGPRARGATLGRGQHFFVSPAQWASHCGGPHPVSGGGRFNKDIYFSDYSLVKEKAEQTIGYSLQNIIQFL